MSTHFYVPEEWMTLFTSELKALQIDVRELEPGFYEASQAVPTQVTSCLLQLERGFMSHSTSIQAAAQEISEAGFMRRRLLSVGTHPTSLQTPRQSKRTLLFERALKSKLSKGDGSIVSLSLRSGRFAAYDENNQRYTEPIHLPAGRSLLSRSYEPPSRAYLKLQEGFQKLQTEATQTSLKRAIDLGACPGGWTWQLLQYGYEVMSLDSVAIDAKLLKLKNVMFQKGNAFRFHPEQPFQVMACDVIAEPQQSFRLLETWILNRWCEQFFVTLKFKGEPDWTWIHECQAQLRKECRVLMMRRLESNKNEIMVMGRCL